MVMNHGRILVKNKHIIMISTIIPAAAKASVNQARYRGPSRATRLGAHLPYFCRLLDKFHRAKAIGNHWGFGTFLD